MASRTHNRARLGSSTKKLTTAVIVAVKRSSAGAATVSRRGISSFHISIICWTTASRSSSLEP